MLSTSDIEGGAARAAYRLHKKLQNKGITSHMLVQNKKSDDPSILAPEGKINKAINLLRPHIDALPLYFYPKHERTWNISWLPNNKKKIENLKPDIIHLHWICKGFIPVTILSEINIPIIWTLHDSWPFTGGCHIPFECKKYIHLCGACPQLGSNCTYDLSRWVYNRKIRVYRTLEDRMILVTPSKWMAECTKQSSLMKNFNIEIIPNGINQDFFKPIEKKIARDILNLPHDKKLILFGGLSPTVDKNKGFRFLIKALKTLYKRMSNIELLIFGSYAPQNPQDFSFSTRYTGRLYDDISLVLLYSASDVVVVPSMYESQSLVTLEALSCGTPVVAFNAGGIPDMVDHMKNGYLAEPYEDEDLAKGIEWVLSNEERYKELSYSARQKVIQGFTLEIITQKYITLYNLY